MKLWSKIPKRLKRIAALSLGAGLSSMGVGNLPMFSMGAVESVLFGASVAIVGLVMGLSFTYAGKGEVADKDFDSHINATIETIQSKAKEK